MQEPVQLQPRPPVVRIRARQEFLAVSNSIAIVVALERAPAAGLGPEIFCAH
jgi:hypothetical protein